MINYLESKSLVRTERVHQSSHDMNDQMIDLLDQTETLMYSTLQCEEEFRIFGSGVLQEAANYHFQTGGQRLRARLALSAGLALGVEKNDCILISCAVELLHNDSLIHDDLQDNDQQRRGQQSIWCKYGSPLAICLGDLYLSSAFSVLAKLSNTTLLPQCFRLTHQRITEANYGQAVDLTQLPRYVNLASYFEIAQAKSGALLSLPFELIFLINHQPQFRQLARLASQKFAVGFQIFDDLNDYPNDRVNILSALQLQEDHELSFSTLFANAKKIATQHLLEAESILSNLPSRSGFLLEQYSTNIRMKIEGSNWNH